MWLADALLTSGGGMRPMRFIVKVKWKEEDGTITRADLGQIESTALQSASDVGLKLSDTKPILTQLQNIVTRVQMDRYCQSVRCCPAWRLPRRVKDYRERRLDSVLGTIENDGAPRRKNRDALSASRTE